MSTSEPQAVYVELRSSRSLPDYHLFIACLGFEQRCTFVPSRYADRSSARVAFAFDSRKVLGYAEHAEELQRLGFNIIETSDRKLTDELLVALRAVQRQIDEPIRVGVDISCFSRLRLAGLILALHDFAAQTSYKVEADILYAPAEFSDQTNSTPILKVAEPVSFEFSGWDSDPEKPLAAIVGLGYEKGRATGIAEFLDAPAVYAFSPYGVDARYDVTLHEANATFFADDVPVLHYDVKDPEFLFVQLETMCYGLSSSHRVNIVPLGPKIFAVCSLLVAVSSANRVAVWRFSGDTHGEPEDHRAEGSIVGLGVQLGRRQTEQT